MRLHQQLSEIEPVFEARRTLVRRARWRREKEDLNVIVKSLIPDAVTETTIAQWEHEFKVLRHLDGDGAPLVYDLIIESNVPHLILSDARGQTLRELLITEQPTIRRLLQIAINVSSALHAVHQRHVVHNDINPDNIIVFGDADEIQLVDFGISSMLSMEDLDSSNSNSFEGSLAYMSPEQTGRMNRSVDNRSDLYSLGITLFEAFVGQVPFPTKDVLETLHAHLAIQPPNPNQLNPQVSETLSAILTKLLAKSPQQRYQSAYGLKRDIERCLRENEMGDASLFTLGAYDGCNEVKLPQKLYGRESALSELTEALFQIRQGGTETICISGHSGIGKTSLVRELGPKIIEIRGHFVAGKFDQYKRDIPFVAFLDAFKELIRQIKEKGEQAKQHYKQAICRAIAGNGQVLLDVIPELESLIGKQPKVQNLQPAESQDRFQKTLLNALRACASADHPLIIFIDDLQWADLQTLDLIRVLNTGEKVNHLLLLLAYRDNEIPDGHPVQRLVRQVAEYTSLRQIKVSNLNIEDAVAFVSDALNMPPNVVAELASLCHKKTSGNPFFLGQFLLSLNQKGWIHYDIDKQSFNWSLEEIVRAPLTDNVVDLMLGKLRELPIQAQNTIRLAACLGNQFDLKRLALLVQGSVQHTAETLWPALVENFIIPEDKTYKFAYSKDSHFSPRYRFAHDRLQQAAYGLIAEEERSEVHRTVGLTLLSRSTKKDIDDSLFEIVNHLLVGKDQIETPTERLQIAKLTLDAFKKSFHANAFSTALNYIKTGIDLLGSRAWESQFELMFEAVLNRGKVEHICGNHETAVELFELSLEKARSAIQRSRVRAEMEDLYINLGQHQKVIDSVLAALADLGFNVPDANSPDDIKLSAEALRNQGELLLGNRSIDDLLKLAPANSQRVIQAHKHLRNLAPPSFFLNMELYFWLGAQNFNLAVEEGNTPLAPFNLSVCGLSNLVRGQVDRAYQLGKLAVELSDREDSYLSKAACYAHFCLINSWKYHYRIDEELAAKAMAYAVEAWDQLFIAWSPYCHIRAHALMGTPLPKVVELAEHYFDIVNKTNIENAAFLRSAERMASCLMGRTINETTFDSQGFEEDSFVNEICGYENPAQAFNYYIYKLQSLFILNHVDHAVVLLDSAAEYESPQWVEVTEYYFYRAMVLASGIVNGLAKERPGATAELKELCEKLKGFAKQNPDNFECRYLLVEAEVAIIDDRKFDAVCNYKAAIESAFNHEFQQIEAIAHERIGRFWLAEKKKNYARLHLKNAKKNFRLWGAQQKVKQLDIEFGVWLDSQVGFLADEYENTNNDFSFATVHDATQYVDVATVIKASQAISTEIKLDKLLSRLMNVVSENAGATRGVLLLCQNDSWNVEVEWIAPDGSTLLQQKRKLQDYVPIAHTVVDQVIENGQPSFVGSAYKDSQYQQDHHVQSNKIRSLLCLPVQHLGKNVAILYLENELVDEMYTANHVQLLAMLTSQIAISIENARLYAELEDRVQQRTTELEESNKELAIKSKALSANAEFLSKLALVAQYTSNAVVITDSDYRTEWVNAGFCRMTGFSEVEAIGQMPVSFLRGENTSLRTIAEIRKCLRKKEPFAGEIINYNKAGDECWVFLQINPVRDEQGLVTRYIGVVTDITERKQMENERSELEDELRNAARIAGRAEIATGVLHNVGNVLNSVNISVSVLQDLCRNSGTQMLNRLNKLLLEKKDCLEDFMLCDPKGRQLPDFLNKINEAIQNERSSTFEELKSLNSNVEHIKMIISMQQEFASHRGVTQLLSAHELVEDAITANRGRLANQGIDISPKVSHELPLINSDKHKILQILVNLIRNAGDSVVEAEVSRPNIDFFVTVKQDGLEFIVSDNGLGISGDKLDKIFQHGFTTKKAGHGFGLHSSANAAQEIGGSLTVSSQGIGHGATFILFVPFNSNEPDDAALTNELTALEVC